MIRFIDKLNVEQPGLENPKSERKQKSRKKFYLRIVTIRID